MPEHDEEDERAGGPPPHPLDRVWFHPTELQGFGPRRPRRRRDVVAPLAMVATLAVAVAAVATVTLLDSDDNTIVVSGSVDVFRDPLQTQRMIAATGASIVTVRVERPEGTSTVSGVCVQRGKVLTSAHVLDGATGVTISVVGGRRAWPALLAGTDPETDLAMLRIDPDATPAARLGAAADLRRDQPVLAVAAGTRRHWLSVGEIEAFDQLLVTGGGSAVAGLIDTGTDAGAQHSGGAVLDEQGRVIAILTVNGDEPAGLALPIDVATDVAGQLDFNGQAVHGWLGVSGTDHRERAAGGAEIDAVRPGGPAQQAGVVAGDVIVAVGDENETTSVSTMGELLDEVRRRRPGEDVELTVLRDGAKRQMPVVITPRDEAADTDMVVPTTTTAP
jgi:putative serine protease PepD